MRLYLEIRNLYNSEKKNIYILTFDTRPSLPFQYQSYDKCEKSKWIYYYLEYT